jgi:S-DNA-T family DNA segregation ATPase FtsK/SpoIIIE
MNSNLSVRNRNYLVVFFVGWVGWRFLCTKKLEKLPSKTLFFSVFLLSCGLLLNLVAEHSHFTSFDRKVLTESVLLKWPYPHRFTRTYLGGSPLYFLYRDLAPFNLQKLLSDVGIALTFSTSAILFLLLFLEIKILSTWQVMKRVFVWTQIQIAKVQFRLEKSETLEKQSPQQIEETLTKHYPQPLYPPSPENYTREEVETPVKAVVRKPRVSKLLKREAHYSGYELPPPSLLSNPKKVDTPSLKKDLRRQADILEETLMSFGIEAKVGDIHCGPTITSFEIHPAVGVKVKRSPHSENDIALNCRQVDPYSRPHSMKSSSRVEDSLSFSRGKL